MREEVAEHALQVRQNIVVPIANDHDTSFGKPACTTVVRLLHLFGVLSAIDFDRQAEARAIEVKREWADRMLLPEVKAFELITTQRVP
jgi:2-methylisocitrate lyase-like PEP mutase family enzyme